MQYLQDSAEGRLVMASRELYDALNPRSATFRRRVCAVHARHAPLPIRRFQARLSAGRLLLQSFNFGCNQLYHGTLQDPFSIFLHRFNSMEYLGTFGGCMQYLLRGMWRAVLATPGARAADPMTAAAPHRHARLHAGTHTRSQIDCDELVRIHYMAHEFQDDPGHFDKVVALGAKILYLSMAKNATRKNMEKQLLFMFHMEVAYTEYKKEHYNLQAILAEEMIADGVFVPRAERF